MTDHRGLRESQELPRKWLPRCRSLARPVGPQHRAKASSAVERLAPSEIGVAVHRIRDLQQKEAARPTGGRGQRRATSRISTTRPRSANLTGISFNTSEDGLLVYFGYPRAHEDDAPRVVRAGEPLKLQFEGTLTPVQEQAVKALLAYDIGGFVAPPGVGKTVVGTYLVAARARTTLILVFRVA